MNSSDRRIARLGRIAVTKPGLPLILFLVVLASAFAVIQPAQTAETVVEVRGNRVFSDDDVLSLVMPDRLRPALSEAGLASLQEAYYRKGYLLARVEVERKAADSSFLLTIEEGGITTYGRVKVSGLRFRSPEVLLGSLGMTEGERFIPLVLGRRMQEVLGAYDEEGYPFVQIWLDSLTLDVERNVVDARVFVVEGQEKILRNVSVEGLEKTRPALAVRLSGLETGKPYRAAALRDAYLRLSGSGVFESVDYPRLRVSADGSGVDAVLSVSESKRSNTFTSALGYATAESGGKNEISGLAQLKLNNIGGSLKDLSAFWSNDGKQRNETRLFYRDSFFFGRNIGFGLFVEQIGLDTLYSWQSIGTEVERPAGKLGGSLVGLSGGVFADRSVFSEGETVRSWRLRFASGFSLLRGGAGGRAQLRTRLRFILARKKTYLRYTGGDENVSQYIVEFEGGGSVRLRPVVQLGIGVVYRGLESSEPVLPLSERFYIGGARTLRGYKENQFNGRRVATTRTELRLGRTRNENIYLFTDTGYVYRNNYDASGRVRNEELFEVGYGFGLRTISPVGNVDLSFGVGEKLSLRQTKVHVFLEQNF